jgi:adenylate cyclase
MGRVQKSRKKELESLLSKRIRNPDNKAEIDETIKAQFTKTMAVMMTDSAGFSSRTVQYGIIQFLAVLHQVNKQLRKVIKIHKGQILSEWADNFVVAFETPGDAVSAGIAMNQFLKEYNTGKPEEDRFEICVGIGCGDLLYTGDDVFGHEVNCASKLGEDIARKEEILVTERTFNALKETPRFCFEKVDTITVSRISLTYYRVLY